MQGAGTGTLWKLRCLPQTSHEARAVGAYQRTLRQIPARWRLFVQRQLSGAVFVRGEGGSCSAE